MRNRAEAMAKPSLKGVILRRWQDKDMDLQTHILQGELSLKLEKNPLLSSKMALFSLLSSGPLRLKEGSHTMSRREHQLTH